MQSSCSIGNSTLVQWVLIFLFVVVCFGFRKKFLIVDSINTMERSLGKGGGGRGEALKFGLYFCCCCDLCGYRFDL